MIGLALLPVLTIQATATVSTALTRFPYLTDSTQTSMTVNATNRSAATGSAQ
jgi:hypothetical protein